MQSIELVLIGVSLILATAVVKLVEGLYQAVTSERSYWIPSVDVEYFVIRHQLSVVFQQ